MKEYNVIYTHSHTMNIDDGEWKNADTLEVNEYPWEAQYPYKPKTLAQMMHNDDCIFLKFDIWEENICATYLKPNDPVCRDSCAEFFFTPNLTDKHYLSFEINPPRYTFDWLQYIGK